MNFSGLDIYDAVMGFSFAAFSLLLDIHAPVAKRHNFSARGESFGPDLPKAKLTGRDRIAFAISYLYSSQDRRIFASPSIPAFFEEFCDEIFMF